MRHRALAVKRFLADCADGIPFLRCLRVRRAVLAGMLIAGAVTVGSLAGLVVAQQASLIRADEQATSRGEAVLTSSRQFVGRVIERVTGARRLSETDAARYAHIFAFQDSGDFAAASAEMAKLSDERLMGHVLAQRYLHPDYRSSYKELSAWLARYADHPQAAKVYALAERRRPKDARLPARPRAVRGVWGQHDFDVGQLAQPYLRDVRLSRAARDGLRQVMRPLPSGPTAALRILEQPHMRKLFSDETYDAIRGDIAEAYFYHGRIDKAYELASASVKRSRLEVPKAGWIAGLSAWQRQQPGEAAEYFEIAAQSPRSSVWMTAAAAHWAARSHLRAGNPGEVSRWLAQSARYPRTFYGLLSIRMLGMEQASFSWTMPSFGERHARALSSVPQGRRALALIHAERPDLAEMELSRLDPGRDKVMQEAMIALANEAGMPGLALRMGSSFRDGEGKPYDAALYPEAPWVPERGAAVDRALIHAFIRQESRFDPEARNGRSGATGLMQIMPSTARHIAALAGETVDVRQLKDPVLNVDLGQKYLAELLAHPAVSGNLFKLAAAYNAGPGKLSRWRREMNYDGDPLFFIESIPAAETRVFVERVLTNYWIYRLKMGQDTESLDAVAAGEWPIYRAQDPAAGTTRTASAE